jgi:feruloyl esterase
VRQYRRLFMLLAVGHCGGSTGPSAIGGGAPEPPTAYRNAETHAVSAVLKWREEGVAPEKIVASRFVSGSLVRQRPVCPYPAQAVYNGVGSIDSADSFTCQTPVLQERNVGASDLLHVLNSLRQRELLLPNR